MIYSVAPRDCPDGVYDKLVEHYRDDPNVTVIVDRREGDRRARGRAGAQAGSADSRRRQRDRRRARVVGELSRVPTSNG